MRESRCQVQITQAQASTPQRGLAAVHRSNVTWVYVAVCNIHGVPPLQWLEGLASWPFLVPAPCFLKSNS